MLGNLRKLKNGSGGEVFNYLATEAYYTEEGAQKHSQWCGKLARRCKLSEHVSSADFNKMVPAQNAANVIGWDLTFSVPKSVSVLALVLGFDDIQKVCERALKSTLTFVEENFLDCRIYDRGSKKQVRKATREAIFAVFEHQENRNLDPQLHFHSVLFNRARDSVGRERAIETQRLFDARVSIGTFFQNELAYHLRGHGYVPDWDMTRGTFEIRDFPLEVIEEFSTRRQEILEFLGKQGEASARKTDIAALFTRKKKEQDVDRKALSKQWLDRLGKYRSGMSQFAKTIGLAECVAVTDAGDWIDQAVSHLEERQTVFEARHLLIEVLKRSRGRVRSSDVHDQIVKKIETGALKRRSQHGKEFLCTPATLIKEAYLLKVEHEGRGQVRPIIAPSVARLSQQISPLGPDQQDAAIQILSSASKVTGVQGYAGTGKTTLLKSVNQVFCEHRRPIFGVAPSVTASKTLQAETQIPSQTLQSFLVRHSELDKPKHSGRLKSARKIFGGATLIIDEASMISTDQMLDFFKTIEILNVEKVVLIGDTAQLKSVGAAQPFSLLQEAGMETATVREIYRQREEGLRGAVYDVIEEDIDEAFSKLDSHVVEDDNTDLAYLAAEAWLKKSAAERKRTMILTQTRKERSLVNEIVRSQLRLSGEIKEDAISVDTNVKVNFTRAQTSDATFYRAGMRLLFKKDYRRLGIFRGDVIEVLGNSPEHNTVMLCVNGKEVPWAPGEVAGKAKDAIEVFERRSVGIAIGDQIRFNRNLPREGVYNGTVATVVDASDDGVVVRKENGEVLTFARDQSAVKHLDYAWASTTHASQGKTVDEVLVVANSKNAHMNTQSSFYVQISRARFRATVFTDDKDQLKGQLLKSLRPKPVHALDLIEKPTMAQKIKEAVVGLAEKVGLVRASLDAHRIESDMSQDMIYERMMARQMDRGISM